MTEQKKQHTSKYAHNLGIKNNHLQLYLKDQQDWSQYSQLQDWSQYSQLKQDWS